MTQEHAKYEQEVIYGTTYDIYIYIYIYRYIEIYIEIKKIHIELVYVGLAHARPNYAAQFFPYQECNMSTTRLAQKASLRIPVNFGSL